VVLVHLLRREHQALRRDALALRIGLQPNIGVCFAFQQPEHRARRAAKDLEPTVEGKFFELLRVIEATEHERIVVKAACARRPLGDDASAVAWLIAGQPQDGLVLRQQRDLRRQKSRNRHNNHWLVTLRAARCLRWADRSSG
jgi:hypothetical protein